MQIVDIGQVYRKVDGFSALWEVVGFVVDAVGIRHVRLRNADDVLTTKLVSEATLRNVRMFRYVGMIDRHDA